MMSETNSSEEALIITSDMLIQMPVKGYAGKEQKITFEKGMSAFPLFILSIMLLNILFFIIEVSSGALVSEQAIIEAGAFKRELVLQGDYWRLISSGFLHGSIKHLLGNLIFLYILGMATEHAFGIRRTIVIYFTALITSSLLSLMQNSLSVGASGAVFGLMGALIIGFWRNRQQFNVRDGNIGKFIGIIALVQLFWGCTDAYTDNWAHFGGLLGGGLIAFFLKNRLGNLEPSKVSTFKKGAVVLPFGILSIIWLIVQGHIFIAVAELGNSLEYYEAAITCSEFALRLNPGNSNAYLIRANSYASSKEYDYAKRDLKEYIKVNPNQITGYVLLGTIADKQEDYKAAIDYYSEAISIKPEANLYNSRGYNKLLLGEYKNARADFQTAIELNSKCASAYGNLGLLDAIDGSYESAIEQIEKSYKLDSDLDIVRGLVTAIREEQSKKYYNALNHYRAFIKKTENLPNWKAENKFAAERVNIVYSLYQEQQRTRKSGKQ